MIDQPNSPSTVPTQPMCGSERPRALRPGILEATDYRAARWPNGIIHYEIVSGGGANPTFSPDMITLINKGIKNWNNALGGRVRFVLKMHPCDTIRQELAAMEERRAELQAQLVGIVDSRTKAEINAQIRALQVPIREMSERLNNCMRLNPDPPLSATDGFLSILRIPDGTGGPNYVDKIGFHGAGQEHKMFLHEDLKNQRYGLGTIHHELGHVLGLHHEQLRPDRDLYLNVFENTIPSKCYPSDWEQALKIVGTAIGPYDVNSVMHYFSHWNRPNLRVTSTVKDNTGNFVPAIGGTIEKTTPHGWAIRILWDNGVVLWRSDPGPLAAGIEYFELSGTWQSNIGVEYFFNQVGGSFSWTAPSLGQQGEGTIDPTNTSGEQPGVIVFEDKNKPGAPVEPNWNIISPETVAGVLEMYS